MVRKSEKKKPNINQYEETLLYFEAYSFFFLKHQQTLFLFDQDINKRVCSFLAFE